MLQRVLYIDDEEDMRVLAKVALENLAGIDVTLCADSRLAVAMALSCRPQLILLDVLMPQKTGPEVLAELKTEPVLADIPVLFLTGNSKKWTTDDLLALGAAGVLTKPFDPIDLPRQIKVYWDKNVTHQQSFDAAMAELRLSYVERLRNSAIFFADILAGKDVPREEIYRAAHTLAGSGATFGFQDVSIAAAALEHAINANNPSDIVQCMETLYSVCKLHT